MKEVKSSDIELVTDALEQYFNYLTRTKNVDLQEFMRFMEPVFAKAGYRDTKPKTDGGNILIIHDSGAGDFITHSGAIREIRRLYPTAHITLIVSPNGFQLAELCPYVDEVILNPRPINRNFLQACVWNMQFSAEFFLKTRFDICYCFTRGSSTPLLMYLSGAKIRISHVIIERNPMMDCELPIPYTVNLATQIIPPYNFGNHVVDANFSLVDHFLHMPVVNRELEVWYTPAEFANAKNLVSNLPRPLYALTMGASGNNRRYPAEKFAALVKMILSEEPTATFINFGGGQADEQSAQILYQQLGEETFKNHVVNLVNKTNYRQSAAIINFCDMYIGNYTGTMHIAAATKCSVLAANCFPANLHSEKIEDINLFSPYRVSSVVVQPKKALPECAVNEPYNHLGCRADKPHCITQIAPETLFEGYKLLKEKIAKKIVDTTYIS